MKTLMITIGNFFFRWRDTAFSLILFGGLILISTPLPDYWITGWFGDLETDQLLSLIGAGLVLLGIFVRALVIGFIYVKRAGDRKKIHADELFQDGLFRHTRNPLYVGNLLVVTGAIFTVNLSLFWFIVLPFFFFVYYCIIFAEEDFLLKQFGHKYTEYMSKVNRLWPGNLLGLNSSFKGLTFKFRRVVKVEHASTSLTLFSVIIVNLLKFRFRYSIGFDTDLQVGFIICLALVIIYFSTAATLKKMKRLEW